MRGREGLTTGASITQQKSNQVGVSCVICCHNGSKRLPEALKFLAKQVTSDGVAWEVIVIDNASTDSTGLTALNCWSSETNVPLRVIYEHKLGLTHARLAGLAHAMYEFVSFIDDDVWVEEDWVDKLFRLMVEHPELGACGGQGEAVFAGSRPAWFSAVESDFTVGGQGNPGDITDSRGWLWGSGLSVRQQACKQIMNSGFSFLLADYCGNSLVGGGDLELCFALRMAGWRLWFEPSLRFSHAIKTDRLAWKEVLRWKRGAGISSIVHMIYNDTLKENRFQSEENCQSFMNRLRKTWPLRLKNEIQNLLKVGPSALAKLPFPTEGNLQELEIHEKIGRIIGYIIFRGQPSRTITDLQRRISENREPL